VLRTADGTEISLPSSLLRLVVSAANNLAAGRAVMAIPAEVMLTPTEAAELLGLSRPFVARLLERGGIPSELLPESRHRRIRLEDVLAFQDRRERRSEGRRRIADIAAAADLPYLCLLSWPGCDSAGLSPLHGRCGSDYRRDPAILCGLPHSHRELQCR
jgi:excisionase family DNA binding protein